MQDPRAGYVLIELLVAMAIIAMIAALAMPSGSIVRSPAALRAKAMEVALLMRGARNQALRSSQTVSVQLDGAARRIRSGGGSVFLPREISARFEIPGGSAFIFRADGRATAGRIVLISGRNTMQVRVDPQTGAVYTGQR